MFSMAKASYPVVVKGWKGGFMEFMDQVEFLETHTKVLLMWECFIIDHSGSWADLIGFVLLVYSSYLNIIFFVFLAFSTGS